MRLRIVRPVPQQIEGQALSHLRFGGSYDVNQPVCDLLLASGYAVPDDAHTDNDATIEHPPTPGPKRRPAHK